GLPGPSIVEATLAVALPLPALRSPCLSPPCGRLASLRLAVALPLSLDLYIALEIVLLLACSSGRTVLH
ncbi:MAG: hypothetical protein ACRDIV_19345, partial [Ktedonobacteraceae bacterium]